MAYVDVRSLSWSEHSQSSWLAATWLMTGETNFALSVSGTSVVRGEASQLVVAAHHAALSNTETYRHAAPPLLLA